jgi:hypothetical protein
MRFVWFWTFWHWSRESFREGSLLRGPLRGVGSHWDEWYLHEASDNDREAIKEAGRTESTQRQFIAWLFLHWNREANWAENRLTPRFVVGQLAQVPPFNQWSAFKEYRASYGVGGISAIVLEEGSLGEAGDVRQVEAIALPDDSSSIAPKVVPEGFQADSPQLDIPHRAAISLLRGKGLLIFLALWITGGRRPYPRWLSIVLTLGWMGVSGLMLYLLAGPDPEDRLFWFVSVLAAFWVGLVLIGLTVVVSQSFRAWRAGKNWSTRLEQSQLRLRMPGGLTLKGSSAGLPFCLNTLLAVYRVDPPTARRSWLWRRFFHTLHSEGDSWAATGAIMPDGFLKSVLLEAKFRACLQNADIQHILTPRQSDAGPRVIDRLVDVLTPANRSNAPLAGTARLGFAAEKTAMATVDLSPASLWTSGAAQAPYDSSSVKRRADQLARIAGTYYSGELELPVTIMARDSALVLQRPQAAEIRFSPVTDELFTNSDKMLLKVVRDDRGAVTGFTLTINRVRDLEFVRR